jgi:outer membrane lipopolysaccharide assembly protein LptE/RlpB
MVTRRDDPWLAKNFHWFSIFSQGADQEHFHWVCFAQVAEAHALKGGAPHSTVVRRVFFGLPSRGLGKSGRVDALYNIV